MCHGSQYVLKTFPLRNVNVQAIENENENTFNFNNILLHYNYSCIIY